MIPRLIFCLILLISPLAAVWANNTGANNNVGTSQTKDGIAVDDIKQVKQKYTEQLMKLPGVNSVGIGLDADGNPSIVVGIDSQQGGGKSQIPSILDGYPVTVKESGPIKAQ